MPMTRKSKAAHMPGDNDHPQITGAGIVKVMIMALIFLLAEEKIGLKMSLVHLAYAVALAVILYVLWSGLKQRSSRRRH
jgi:hypothetical protein